MKNLIHYSKGIEVIIAYWKFLNDLALALTNDTSKIVDDIVALFEFEREIQEVNFFSHKYFLFYFF